MGALNHCRGAELPLEAQKIPNNVTSTFFNTINLPSKELGFDHRGAKLRPWGHRFDQGGAEFVFCPGRHLTSLHSCLQSTITNVSTKNNESSLVLLLTSYMKEYHAERSNLTAKVIVRITSCHDLSDAKVRAQMNVCNDDFYVSVQLGSRHDDKLCNSFAHPFFRCSALRHHLPFTSLQKHFAPPHSGL